MRFQLFSLGYYPARQVHRQRNFAMTKTISFGVVHFTVAFTVAYLLSGSFLVGGAIALVEPAINTMAYFFHERIWERIRQGRAQQPALGAMPA